MARQSRIHYAGALYHIIARGNNREVVFHDGDDKSKYLALVERYKQKYQFHLYAYAIMDNHVHLLGGVADEPLSKIMQGIQQSYTQYYNRKYDRVGHVFEQRYKAKLCNSDQYLVSLLRYIHQNPLKAGTSQTCWTSHPAYQTGNSNIVDTEFILSMLSNNKTKAIQKYMEYMEVELSEIQQTETFEHIYSMPKTTETSEASEASPVTFDELLTTVASVSEINKERIMHERHDRRVVEARNILIYVAVRMGVMTKTELTKVLPLSMSGIIGGYNKVVDRDELKRLAEKISKQFV
ncbi:hypothetical protein AXX12_06730 [Anaerosporomusa subterranea]|uniref:Transposase IS200-like domain-containing protein n=1 Tax=Anaerosporomusa subterranea TaxID=1794912 RepID=A0A154BQB2_ANASB|nr:transposase [Anaerosporomusa subterranea]KYZ76132.1 hypothetical protein AXX12_06730 [Anaerosporomusa subterranea]